MIYACLYISYVYCPWEQEEGVRSPGSGVTDNCEPLNLCAWMLEIQPRSGRALGVLKLLSHLCSPNSYFDSYLPKLPRLTSDLVCSS